MGSVSATRARTSNSQLSYQSRGRGAKSRKARHRNTQANCLDARAGCSVFGAGRYYEVSSARGLRLAIISSFRAACWGLRVPCSQLRTAFVLTLR